MSQTNLNNVAEEIINDPVVAPAVEAVDAGTTEVVEEAEGKRKSFFDIFKKKKSTVEKSDEAAAEEANADGEATATEEATEATEETAAADVPVEEKPAKKCSMCGLCAFGKKKDEPVAESEAAEEALVAEEAAEEAPVAEEAAAETVEPVATEEAVVTDAPVEETVTEPVTEEAVATEEAAPAEPEVEVTRAGLLHKSGKFLKSRFNPRHVRLLPTGTLQWSKTDTFATDAHEIKLCKDSSTVAFMAEGEEAEHKYRFELHCCKDVITFAADSEEDRDEWIRAIETVKEKLVDEVVAEAETEAVTEEVKTE